MSHECKTDTLIDRAQMLRSARNFFFEKGVVEVDTPLLSQAAPIDTHIDVMRLSFKDGSQSYLHTSPEYAMKRLLALGMKDIYQLSHVYREGEIGPLHNPEFTMVEWYRLGIDLLQMINETEDFIRLFLGDLPAERITYREALIKYADLDYIPASPHQIRACACSHGLALSQEAALWDKDTLLQALMSFIVEPHLGKDALSTIYQFPASQAALAKTATINHETVASRFEIYYKGIELANGYHELTNASEQRRRFNESNQKRVLLGKEQLKIDENLLAALEQGLPDCCGVAVGFDRLMLLRHDKKTLAEILPFSWHNA